MPSECCQLKFKNPLHQKRKLKNDSLFRKKVENNFETLWKPEKIELNISPDFEEKQKKRKNGNGKRRRRRVRKDSHILDRFVIKFAPSRFHLATVCSEISWRAAGRARRRRLAQWNPRKQKNRNCSDSVQKALLKTNKKSFQVDSRNACSSFNYLRWRGPRRHFVWANNDLAFVIRSSYCST